MKLKIDNHYNNIFSWSFVLLIFSSLLAFTLFHADSMVIEVHDNLDSVHVWLSILAQNNLFFSPNDVSVPFLGGISRGYLPSELQLANIIYFFWEPLTAHYINYFLKLVIGTASFYLLGRYIFGAHSSFKIFGPIVALSFALLPGYENLFIAQASVPLIFYLYLRAINSNSLFLILTPIIYPVLSEFPRYGIFLCGIIFIYTLYLVIQGDQRYKRSFVFLAALVFGYLITDYRVFHTMLISGEETIRATMISPGYDFFKGSLKTFLLGQYHAQSIHLFLIIPTLLISSYFIKNEVIRINSAKLSIESKVLLICLALITVHSLIYGLYGVSSFKNLVGDIIPQLAGFNFSRFMWLNPTLWYLAFAAALLILSRRIHKPIIVGTSMLQLFVVLCYPTYSNDIANTIRCRYLTSCNSQPSYREFYSSSLFEEIKSEINYSEEGVLAFGLHPSVLTYNGFYTMDGYHNSYSKSYKNKFRTIITPALEDSNKYREYFDNWGGRAYLFSEQADFKPSKNIKEIIVDIPFDPQAARELGVRYILSLYEFDISKSKDVKYIAAYSQPEGFYKIFVYKI